MMRLPWRELLRFGGVGSVGFVLDGGLLWALITWGVDPYLARFGSFPAAVLVTWWLNRIWTFSKADRAAPAAQFNRYMVVQICGALCNYMVFALVMKVFQPGLESAMAGFALGSAAGLMINFYGARRLVFTA